MIIIIESLSDKDLEVTWILESPVICCWIFFLLAFSPVSWHAWQYFTDCVTPTEINYSSSKWYFALPERVHPFLCSGRRQTWTLTHPFKGRFQICSGPTHRWLLCRDPWRAWDFSQVLVNLVSNSHLLYIIRWSKAVFCFQRLYAKVSWSPEIWDFGKMSWAKPG